MNTNVLNEKFGQIHHLTRRIMHQRRAEQGGPTGSQRRILAALKLQDKIPTRDLAFILGIRVPSLNESLVKLEQKELITREKSSEDGRIMLVSLTDAGRDAAAESRGGEEMFEGFSEEDRTRLGEYLDRILANLEKATKGMDEHSPEDWERAVRERMGDERFEQWMARAEKMGMRGPRGFGRGFPGGRHSHGDARGEFPGESFADKFDDDARGFSPDEWEKAARERMGDERCEEMVADRAEKLAGHEQRRVDRRERREERQEQRENHRGNRGGFGGNRRPGENNNPFPGHSQPGFENRAEGPTN